MSPIWLKNDGLTEAPPIIWANPLDAREFSGTLNQRGQVRFVDRRKDVIVVTGSKGYHSEIEDVVMLPTGAKKVGAVGAPDVKSCEGSWSMW